LNNTAFYLANPWGSRYRAVKNCNVIIDAVANTTLIPDNQKKAYTGFAKTLKAHELLMNLNLTYSNGIRVDVDDPKNLGPVLNFDQSITAIANLLDEGKADLTGAEVVFSLGDGFDGFTDADGLIKFNRALAARVDVYRQQWSTALTDLGLSFYDLTGDFTTGVYQVFSAGAGDQLNSAFFPQNNTGEVRLAHPSFTTDMEANDDRAAKATLRTAPASYGGLSGDKDAWVYTSSTAPIPVVRNEELILIYAEANIQSDNLAEGVKALNVIRTGHNLPVYSGAVTKEFDFFYTPAVGFYEKAIGKKDDTAYFSFDVKHQVTEIRTLHAGFSTFKYDERGNVASLQNYKADGTSDLQDQVFYSYDNEKSYFSGIAPNNYYLMYILYSDASTLINNAITRNADVYTYTYNKEGYPVKATAKVVGHQLTPIYYNYIVK